MLQRSLNLTDRCSRRKCKVLFGKFTPGSDKYMEAWTALDERFGRVDTVVSAAKRRADKAVSRNGVGVNGRV